MKSRSILRVLRPLVVVLTGLILALPLLGLDCEMACARSDTDRGPVSNHCAAHDSAPAGSSQAPARAGCGHHAHSAVLKQASEGAQRCLRVASVPLALLAPAARAGRGSSVGAAFSAREVAPLWLAARPDILRL